MIGTMTVALAGSSVNVAFPEIMGAFGIGRDQAQLLSTGYFAAQTAGMLLSAWLIEVIGERRTCVYALLTFLVGCMLSGLADNPESLIFGRVVQGVSSGVIQPLGMAVTFRVFPAGSKGFSMGIYSLGMVLAPSLGPTMGGIAITEFSWRAVFLLSVPMAFLALVFCSVFLPTREMPKTIPRFDFLGFSFLCASLVGFLLGFSYGQRLGWTSSDIIGLFAIAFIGAAGFILRQLYGSSPLVNLSLFKNVQFSAAALIAFFTGCAFLSSTFMLPLFVQQIQHYSALDAGLIMIPAGLSLLILFPLAGRLSDIVAPQYMIYVGLLFFAAAYALMAQADVNTPFWTIVGLTLLMRAGTAFTRPVTNTAALKSLPSELVNQGASSINFVRKLGAALGTNSIVVFMELRIPFHGDAFAATQTGARETSQEMTDALMRLFAEAGVPEAIRAPGVFHYLSDMIYAQASTMGYHDAFMVLAIVALLGVAPAWVMAQSGGKQTVRVS